MDNDTAVKKTLLSGIQPSGDLHLGNYLGAVRNWAALPDEFNCFYFMADLHTLTVRQNPAELRRRSTTQLAQYIACGLDPEKNVLFLQSHVHEHAELGWILNCYTMFGELSRMTQFKDKCAKNADNINGRRAHNASRQPDLEDVQVRSRGLCVPHGQPRRDLPQVQTRHHRLRH